MGRIRIIRQGKTQKKSFFSPPKKTENDSANNHLPNGTCKPDRGLSDQRRYLLGLFGRLESTLLALPREQPKKQLEKAHFNLAMKKDSSNNTFTQNNTESGYVTPDESVELEEVAVPTTEILERGAMLKPIKIVKQEAHYQPGPLSAFLMTPNGGLALTPLLHGSFAFPADSNSELFNAEFCQL